MGCDKVRLREEDALECPLCMEQVEQCDECGDSPVVNEDWYCYSDGDKHYCGLCWDNQLRKKTKPAGKIEDLYKEFKDKDGKYVRCPICGDDKHTDGRCELQEYNYYERR